MTYLNRILERALCLLVVVGSDQLSKISESFILLVKTWTVFEQDLRAGRNMPAEKPLTSSVDRKISRIFFIDLIITATEINKTRKLNWRILKWERSVWKRCSKVENIFSSSSNLYFFNFIFAELAINFGTLDST